MAGRTDLRTNLLLRCCTGHSIFWAKVQYYQKCFKLVSIAGQRRSHQTLPCICLVEQWGRECDRNRSANKETFLFLENNLFSLAVPRLQETGLPEYKANLAMGVTLGMLCIKP